MRLIWIRHGETDANRDRRYCGHLDAPLNDGGRVQAEAAARALGRLPVTRLYTSDLSRCLQTSEFLRIQWPGADITADPALRELSFGVWEGLTYEEIRKRDPGRLVRWIDDPDRIAPPGGETLADLDVRLSRWLERTSAAHPGETVAAVSHGGPIRCFLSRCLARDPGGFWNRGLPRGGWLAAEGVAGCWREITIEGEEETG